jgi:hypothetical protein
LASRSSSFTLSRVGPPTGDLHPIYNAPMLGVHKVAPRYLPKARLRKNREHHVGVWKTERRNT